MTMGGLTKTWEKAKTKASPLRADLLDKVMGFLMGENPANSQLKNHRLAALLLCLWHGLARFEEMQKVKIDQVRRLPGGSWICS